MAGQPVIQWPAEAIWEAVAPHLPGFTVEVLPEIDSTNTELMRRARAGQFDPVLLVAEKQTSGRGRMGRPWMSPQAAQGARQSLPALTFSLGLELSPAEWSGLSLAVGLCVVEALHADLQLKWPNDVWLHGRKLAGILIETASVGAARYVVVGVGINMAKPDAQGLSTLPASLDEVLPDTDAPAALMVLAPALVQTVLRFQMQGFAPLTGAFEHRDALKGKVITCSDGTTGTAQGVDESGALLVHTAGGLKRITSAEVSVRPAA
jgi:BirA family biotin operon repressor/biotin-[acetyl-CoA-carboxylase] ligase